MWWLYNLLLTVASPVWVPWMLVRANRRKPKPNWSERTGNLALPPRGSKRRVWVHAVSVGEVIAAKPILRALRSELPSYEIVLSVTTSSGHETATTQAESLYDHLVYFPIDVPRFALAAMQRVRPDVVAIMETELWMNFLWAAKVFGARTMLVNGRISDRSYRRSKPFAFFFKALLKEVDRCLMQTTADCQRIRDLGAVDAAVFGNCKFDQAAEGLQTDPASWRELFGLDPAKPTVVVGSLRAEEFAFFAEAVKGIDGVQWIVAPRHLERTDELVKALPAESARRSKHETMPDSGYLLLDTYGELSQLYAAADFAVVGGGFANLGGQNLIQPLAHGKPVLHGPHMQNFRDVATMAVDAGASQICATPDDLACAMRDLIANPTRRREMGDAAKRLVKENVGASTRYAKAIAEEVVKGGR